LPGAIEMLLSDEYWKNTDFAMIWTDAGISINASKKQLEKQKSLWGGYLAQK
jgi:hypothetical protein